MFLNCQPELYDWLVRRAWAGGVSGVFGPLQDGRRVLRAWRLRSHVARTLFSSCYIVCFLLLSFGVCVDLALSVPLQFSVLRFAINKFVVVRFSNLLGAARVCSVCGCTGACVCGCVVWLGLARSELAWFL